METYQWPADLVPYVQGFHLQAHSGGSESPFSRVTKTYGLSAPRWVAQLGHRGGVDGVTGIEAFGPRIEAFLSKLNGREHRFIVWDFRREGEAEAWSSAAVSAGGTTVTLTGGAPNVGWNIGGDGRPHIVTDVQEGIGGSYVVSVRPPFSRDLGVGEIFAERAWGFFMLVSDDAAASFHEVGTVANYSFEAVEDLGGPAIDGTPSALEILGVAGEWETFQWYVDGVAVPGATGASFELTPGDEGAIVKALVGLDRGGAIFTRPTREIAGYDFSAYFAGGLGGAWYDPSDLGTLWADTAGTVPAVVDGPVARMDDKSGNGNHLVQATAGNRPVLRRHTVGTYFLESDGTNDFMRVLFTLNQPFDRVSCIRPLTWTDSDTFIAGATTGEIILQQSGTTPHIRMWAGTSVTPTLAPPLNNTIIVHERWNDAGSRLRIYPNPPQWGNFGSNDAGGVTLFANFGETAFAQVAFYGMMVRDTLLTDIEVDRYASYLRTRRPLPAADYVKDYFAWNGLTMPWYSRSVSYNAKYNPNTNKTWFSWEGGRPGTNTRQIFVNVYDHGRSRWSGMHFVGNGALTDDDHGVPAIEFLPDGRVLCMFGSHNTPQKQSVSTNPDDPSAWTALSDLGDFYTYPHPHLIGGELRLFMRFTPGGTTAGGTLPLHLFKSTSISGTSISWGSPTNILDFGADSRVYNLKNIIVGGKIHMLVQRSNIADSLRWHFYYLVYDPTDDSISNMAGTHTAAIGDAPIDLTEANTHFRIIETETDEYNHADWCIDEASGIHHVVYSNHDKWWYRPFTNGTPGADVELVDQTGGFQLSVQPTPGGGAEFVYSEDDADNWVNGGNIRCIPISSEGVPDASELIMTPPGTDFLYQAAPVGYAHPEALHIWAECEQDQSNERGTLRMYAWSRDTGFLKRRYA